MKRKIYAKLFKFTPSKSWENTEKSVSTTTKKTIVSYFYNEYTLEYINDGMFWNYNVYQGRNTYHSYEINSGIVTLNKTGKLLVTALFYCISLIVFNSFTKIDTTYVIQLEIIAISYLLSYFIFSIFNWKIYRTFRRAKYAANNVKKLQKKEEEEKLYDEVTNIVNRTIARDPKLARKIKLNQLNKKYFWEKWFNKEEKSFDGEQL